MSSQLQDIAKYTTCDLSDALQRLGIANGGFVPDVSPYNRPFIGSQSTVVGRASTVLFASADEDSSHLGPRNLSDEKHWVDCVEEDTVVIISQPEGQHNGVLGGITALRLKMLNIRGVVVHGRVRDIKELCDLDLGIWSKGTSTVSPEGLAIAHSMNIPLNIGGVMITAGDVVLADANGVVVVPQAKVDEVLHILPTLVSGDIEAMEAVKSGMSVTDAFRTFRGRS